MCFYVILNEVKDLELINMTRFFASLRMTNSQLGEFFNNLLIPISYSGGTPMMLQRCRVFAGYFLLQVKNINQLLA
jgi:hypothetical protein